MDMSNQELLESLTNELDNASRLYYQGKDSGLSDTMFDVMLKDLQKLERELGIVLPNSPTQRVGSDLQTEFKKIKHPFPMLTIENTYEDDELKEWLYKMIETYGKICYNVSVKYDGISCELHYKDGVLVSGSTRGDKNVGDDITANVKTIKSIPLKLAPSVYAMGDVYVRGEILMPKTSLQRLNDQLASEGKKTFANCRNACSGSVKQLDPRVTASRGLIFRPWDIFSSETSIPTQTDKSAILEDLGFIYEKGTQPWSSSKDYPDEIISEVNMFCQKLKAMDLDYDWDGIVLKVNSVELQEEIGTKDNRSIEWGIARKWNDKEVITRLVGVDFQVGRTGNITPVGKLEPVPCDGVVISSVILNNEQYVQDLGLSLGAPIRIVRSGSVIPKAIGSASEEELEAFRGKPTYNKWSMCYFAITFPETCPVCGSKLEKVGEIWKCPNYLGCPAQTSGLMEQWCSKQCMDIEGVGPSVIEDLAEKLHVSTPLDLYNMVRDTPVSMALYNLGTGYGEKSIKTMYKNIEASKTKPFETILFGMGIPGIGKENAKAIAREMKSLSSIMHARLEDLISIEGIGAVLASNIQKWMDAHGQEWLDGLTEHGMATEFVAGVGTAQNEQILEGLNVVFTGKSAHWEGDQVEAVLSSYGAKCGHAVNKKVNYLITGAKPGAAKVSKANQLGIEIVTEAQFIAKYGIPTDSLDIEAQDYEAKKHVSEETRSAHEEELF